MLSINQNKCNLCGECIKACPFGAMEQKEGRIEISAACKMCENNPINRPCSVGR